jgi:hypothetical protein
MINIYADNVQIAAGGSVTTKLSLSTVSSISRDEKGEAHANEDIIGYITIPTVLFLGFIKDSLTNIERNEEALKSTTNVDLISSIINDLKINKSHD